MLEVFLKEDLLKSRWITLDKKFLDGLSSYPHPKPYAKLLAISYSIYGVLDLYKPNISNKIFKYLLQIEELKIVVDKKFTAFKEMENDEPEF